MEKVTGTRYIAQSGYVFIKVGIRKWRQEHRLVVERELGRPLSRHEHVHHINHVKTDNRPENLQVLTNTEHYAVHHLKH